MAVGGSVIVYGGMTFYNTLIRAFNQEIAYDDSGTDAIAFKFNIASTVFIHGLSLARMGVLPTTGDGDAGNNMAQIRYLFAPRQHFEYRIGVTTDNSGNIVTPGALLLVADPVNAQQGNNISLRDVNNGPKAKVMNIVRMAADNLFRVDVEFEIWQVQCNSSGTTGNTSGVLNNRWSIVDDIDRSFMTTRTWSGKLRCSSSQLNANNFRNLVVPPLQLGMRREHMNFAVAEDGLSMAYTITDKEVAFAPPAPATTWSARFGERREYDGQLGFFVDAEITLGGDRLADKQKLIQIAASMAEAKFQNGAAGFAADASFYVQSISVIDEYTDDTSLVHVRATARRTDSSTPGLWGLTTTRMGKPIELADISSAVQFYDSRYSRGAGGGYGNLEIHGPIPMVGAFTAYLQGPCQINYAIANGIPAQDPSAPAPGSLPSISASVTNGIPDDGSITSVYGSENQQGVYTYYLVEVHEDTESNAVQMPIGATGSGSSGSSLSLGSSFYDGTSGSGIQQGSVVVDLAPPTPQKEAIIQGERIGSPPDMIKPENHTDANGIDWRITGVTKSRANPKPTSDGKMLYRTEYRINWAGLAQLPIASIGANLGIPGFAPWAKSIQTTVPVEVQVNPPP